MRAWCRISIRVSPEHEIPGVPGRVSLEILPDSKALRGYLRIHTKPLPGIGPGRAFSKMPDRPKAFQPEPLGDCLQ